MNRKPNFDDLVGTETRGAERERLRGAHDLLLQAGPPPELTPRLEKAPDFGVVSFRRRAVKKRPVLVLLAAALSAVAVFAAGYAVANNRGGSQAAGAPVAQLALKGTPLAPQASATLAVWRQQRGNWPMTLSVAGLPKVPLGTYYEVYLVRGGKPWGSCGTFRIVGSSRGPVTVTLTAPYSLRPGDSWIVTRAKFGGEPGRTVLRPVTA